MARMATAVKPGAADASEQEPGQPLCCRCPSSIASLISCEGSCQTDASLAICNELKVRKGFASNAGS